MPVEADIIDDRIVLNTERPDQPRVKALLGARHDKVLDKWTLPLTWTSAVSLLNEFKDRFLASPALNEWGFQERDNRIGPAMALRDRLDLHGVDRSKSDRSTDLALIADQIGDELGLHPYQKVGAAWAATIRRGMLLDEQGTGKTVQTISAIKALQRNGENPFPVVVIAPATVKRVWEREFEHWYPELTVVNVKGSAVQRRKQLTTPAHVYIISYNTVTKHSKMAKYGSTAIRKCVDCGGCDPTITEDKCQAHVRELNTINPRTVVVDEAHRLLNPTSTWTRSVWALSDKADYMYALTGTPVQESVADYWSLLRLVSPKEFPAKTKFLDRYAMVSYNPWGAVEVNGLNPMREGEFHAVTTPYTRRVLKDIVLSFLPPIVTETRTVPMGPAQSKAYRDMEKTLIAELDGSVEPMVATKPIFKAMRLMQLASSYAEVLPPDPSESTDENSEEPTSTVKLKAPSNKVNAFLEDIAAGDYDQTGAGVVVFAQSRQLLEILSKEMTAKGIEHGMITGAVSEDARNAYIDDFQAGKFKFILVSISCGGAGLTLTAADTMVFLQRSWSSTGMEQAYARAHRIGSEIHESVRIIHYLSEKTVEEGQLEALEDKGTRAEEILRDDSALLEWMTKATRA